MATASKSIPNPLQEVVARTQGFAGGVNLRDAINLIGPDELRVSENGVLDEKGGWSKRNGCISNGTFGVGTDRALSLYTFYRGASAPQVLMHTTGGKLYYTNDPTVSVVVWTQIATGLSTTVRFSYETFNGKCYFSNGVDNYASWDGTTYTTYASAPKGKYLRLWKDTMWVSGITGFPDRVYSSNPGDAETFGVASWVDIAKGDGDQVMGLGSDGLFLIVFKRNRYMVVYDPVVFSNRVVDYEKGCEGHFTILQFEGDIYFLSRRGVCKYDPNSPAPIVSVKLDPLFDPAILNLGALDASYAYTIGNRIGWALPEAGSTIPTMQIECYPRLANISQYGFRGFAPFVFHRMPATCFTRYRNAGVEFLYGGKSTENKFLYLFANIGTDDGATFVGIMETGAYDFGAPTRTKYIRRCRVLGRGHPIVILKRNFKSATYKSFPIDMSSGTDLWSVAHVWGSGTWGPDSLFKEALINPDAYGRYFQIRITDAQTATGKKLIEVGSQEYSVQAGEWAVYGVIMDADLMGMRD